VTEWVPEKYEATRTVLKTEYFTEKYTAYKTVCEPEQKTRTFVVNKIVPEVVTRTRTICVPTTVVEERTVSKPVWTENVVTEMVCKRVDRGHYETREVPCEAPSAHRGGGFSHRLFRRHNDSCCEPCPDPCAPPPTKCVQVWVPCWVTEQIPVARTVRTCTYVNEVVKVNVCKLVPQTQTYEVTINRCVPEPKTETYTVMVPRQVAYEATRTVAKCVPVVETYTACRMVPHCVEKQVPVESCDSCCTATSSHGRGHFSGGRFLHRSRGCCN
jgi:hypothetical protein